MSPETPLNVLLVLRSGGDYGVQDVLLIARRLHHKHPNGVNIRCLNDKYPRKAIHPDVLFIPLKYKDIGWWAKMEMFRPDLESFRPFLFLDLDTMVVGSLDNLLSRIDKTNFITITDLYGEKYGNRMQSAIMWVPANSDKISSLWEAWIGNREDNIRNYIKRSRGDQTFIDEHITTDARFQDIDPDAICSIKPLDANGQPQLLQSRPPKASLICLHGKPKLAEACRTLGWVREYCAGFLDIGPDANTSLRDRLYLESRERLDSPAMVPRDITILIPSRGRPEMIRKTIDSIANTALHPDRIQVIAYIDSNDPKLLEYIRILDGSIATLILGPSSRGVEPGKLTIDKIGVAWNEMAKMADGLYIMMGNDDIMYETPEWDAILMRRLRRFPDQMTLAWCYDGINDGSRCCFPIISKRWAEACGFFVPEYFQFLYHDTWIHDVALQMAEISGEPGRIMYLDDVRVIHYHAGDKRKIDATHTFNRTGDMHEHDRSLYFSPQAIHMRKAQGINMAKNWGIYPAQDMGHERMKKLFTGRRVALVGPSPHLAGKGMGELIDGYDCVCRVNELAAFDQETDYGSRTDAAFYTFTDAMPHVFERALNRFCAESRELQLFVKMLLRQPSEWFGYEVMNKFPYCTIGQINPIKRKYFCDWIKTCPNTGILSLAMIASYEPSELYLTGFSFYSLGESAEQKHSPSYLKWGGDEATKKSAIHMGHVQEPQKKWMVEEFLPTYKDIVKVDDVIADILEISHMEMKDPVISVPEKPKDPEPVQGDSLVQRCVKLWKGKHSLEHQYRGGQGEWDDEDGPEVLRTLCGEGLVCEVGCGIGRVAALFDSSRYIGLDINQYALEIARGRLPGHQFQLIEHGECYPEAEVYLFHTLLLHIPDEEIPSVLSKLQNRVVVFESMHSSLGDGKHNFQRDPEWYLKTFESMNFAMMEHRHLHSRARPGFRDYMVFEKRAV